MSIMRLPVEQRFWSKVNKETCVGDACGCHQGIDHCWPWTAGLAQNGYGKFKVWVDDHWTHELAHRTSYRLTHGSIPEGLWVCHACDYKPCCRPLHLWPGTVADNTRDAYNKGRLDMEALWARGCTPEVWAQISGEKHYNAKLTEPQVREIIALTGTMRCRDIADRYSVSAATVCYIQTGKKWKHLTGLDPLNPRRNRGTPKKLTTAQALEIIKLKGVMTCKAVGVRYGVSPSTVANIQTGKDWKHLHAS